MQLLAIFLLLFGSEEGSAVTGNPARPLSEEHKIKAVISRLEEGLLMKDLALITSCLTEKTSNKELKEVEEQFASRVRPAQASEGKPLVVLQNVQVEVDGEEATAKVEMFSYGNDKRIKAVHRIPFRRDGEHWGIAETESLTAVFKQVGDIIPLKHPEAPGTKETPEVEIAPAETSEEKSQPEAPSIEVTPGDEGSEESAQDKNSSEVQVSSPAEATTSDID